MNVTSDEVVALRAEVALLHRKTDALGRALLFLANHFASHLQGDQAMSAATDIIKARLTKLDAAIDQAATTSAAIKAAAQAEEDAELTGITTMLDAMEAKLDALPHAATMPAAN